MGGINTPDTDIKKENMPLTLSGLEPTRDGYTFSGWSLSSSDSNIAYMPGDQYTKNADITLYAVWSPIEYSISYNLDGGTAKGNPVKYSAESSDIKLNRPTKDKMVFAGWTGTNLDEKTKDVVIPKGSHGNREYTANWEEPLYVVNDSLYYATLEEAFNICSDNSIIKVLKTGIDSSAKIENTKNVTLNLNGYTITTTKTINNIGTLHITGINESGEFTGGKINNTSATCINNKGVLQLGEDDENINNTLAIEGTYGIENSGTLKFYDGQIIGNKAVRGTINNTPTDYKAISSNAGGKEIITLGQLTEYQARIYDVYYSTIQKAFDTAQEDETVVLLIGLSNIDPLIVQEGKNFKFDLNGYSLATNKTDYLIKNYGEFAILNNSENNTNKLYTTNYDIIYNSGTLNIESGVLNFETDVKDQNNKNIIYNDGGTINILDGTFTSSSSYINLIYNNEGTFNMQDGELSCGNTYSNCVYNNGGAIDIQGGTININETYSKGIYNVSNTDNLENEINIENATITVYEKYSYGLYNENTQNIKLKNVGININKRLGVYNTSIYGIFNNNKANIDIDNCIFKDYFDDTKYKNDCANIYVIYNDDLGIINLKNSEMIFSASDSVYLYGVYNKGTGIIKADNNNFNIEMSASTYPSSARCIRNDENGEVICDNLNIECVQRRGSTYCIMNNSTKDIVINNLIGTFDVSYVDSHIYVLYNSGTTGNIKINEGDIKCSAKAYMDYDCKFHVAMNTAKETGGIILDGVDMNFSTEDDVTETYCIYNKSEGSIKILNSTEDTINMSGADYGIVCIKGTVEIGEKDGKVNNNIVITGKESGVLNQSNFKFYDGIINGKSAISGRYN